MDTGLTCAKARLLYGSFASSESAFIPELNEVLNRLMGSELWEGCTEEVLFAVSTDGYIVLPRFLVAVLGYQVTNVPRPVFGKFFEYAQQGFGWQDVSTMSMAGLIDWGRVCTQKEISGTATLRVKISSASDAGKVVRFYGLDANEKKVFSTGVDGFDLTLASPSADTTQTLTKLTGIQAPPDMIGHWTLWQVVSGTETQIGAYEPGEDIPNFRRYKVGIRTTDDVIRCFCRRQFVPVLSETDWVFPGCFSAIKFGLKSVRYEAAGNDDDAAKLWARAEKELDKELAVYRGSEVQMLNIRGVPRSMAGFVN